VVQSHVVKVLVTLSKELPAGIGLGSVNSRTFPIFNISSLSEGLNDTMAEQNGLVGHNLAFSCNELIELIMAFGPNELIELIMAFGCNHKEHIEFNNIGPSSLIVEYLQMQCSFSISSAATTKSSNAIPFGGTSNKSFDTKLCFYISVGCCICHLVTKWSFQLD
jgi:hypothetical protein